MRKLLSILLAASVTLAPTASAASDFAELGHPAFQRSMIMGMKLRREIRCLARWTESGERVRLAPLAEEIVRRAEISIGYPHLVGPALRFDRPPDKRLAMIQTIDAAREDVDPREIAVRIVEQPAATAAAAPPMPAECTLLAERFDQGGLAAATALLGPSPTHLLPLPSAGTCLSFLKFRQQLDPSEMRRMLARVRAASDVQLPADQRASILRDAAAFNLHSTITYGDPAVTQPLARNDLGEMLCFGALVELQMRLRHPEDPPIDMIDSHVRLMLYDPDQTMLDDVDAQIAAHPELLNDPAAREALGIIADPPPT